jgi:hypothetical protein
MSSVLKYVTFLEQIIIITCQSVAPYLSLHHPHICKGQRNAPNYTCKWMYHYGYYHVRPPSWWHFISQKWTEIYLKLFRWLWCHILCCTSQVEVDVKCPLWACTISCWAPYWCLGIILFKVTQYRSTSDFRPPSRWGLDLRSSGILCSAEWQFCTDVSGQPMDPIFNGCSKTSVQNYHSMLHNIPDERRSQYRCILHSI